MISKDTHLHIRINTKIKQDLDKIAHKMNIKTSKLLTECIIKIIEKNYKLLEN
jgi:antitoxin component of RelBE/YafQ-DinJ toxin-antitoxin module